jgi:hypothetical protein
MLCEPIRGLTPYRLSNGYLGSAVIVSPCRDRYDELVAEFALKLHERGDLNIGHAELPLSCA